jgi:hypothetical protein
MPMLGDLVRKVASKNAGPFWVTVDVFCGSPEAFACVAPALETERVAALFGVQPSRMKRFEIEALHVVKFSLPRPIVQGCREDHDMHGAQFATLLEELELDV